MFERYTEKARRTIFFGRYEASQLGSSYIETEHLLLGILREDKALAVRFLKSSAKIEAIREAVEQHTTVRERVSTSVDMPLSHECKRARVYAAEESERMNHKHIDTEHLLLGLLREEKCFAARLLHEQGVTLDEERAQAKQSGGREGRSIPGLNQWLAESEARGLWTVMEGAGGGRTTYFAIYANDAPTENEKPGEMTPTQKVAQIQQRLNFVTNRMERAIADHEFEKARSCLEEQRKERENLRRLREQFNLEEPPASIPLVWIEVLANDCFVEVQQRCDEYIEEGIAEVWLLEPGNKRAYTFTKADGFREFRGEVLRIGNPPLEMDLKKIFG